MNERSGHPIMERVEGILARAGSGASVDDLVPLVRELTMFCPFWTVKTADGTHSFFRARRLLPTEKIEHVSQLSYPPAEFARIGRCNRSGAPVMYLAQAPRTAMFEIHLEKDDLFIVSKFDVRAGQSLNLMHVGMFNLPAHGAMQLATRRMPSDLKDRAGLNFWGVRNAKKVHQALGGLFLRDVTQEAEYLLTIAVAEHLTEYEGADGFAYPSKKSPNDFNVALKPRSADSKLSATNVWFCQASEANAGAISFNFLQNGVINAQSGDIGWRVPTQSDIELVGRLTAQKE
jgi:hypothetical protein